MVKGPIQPNYVCGRTRSAEYRLITPIGDRGGEGWVWQAEYLAPSDVRCPEGLSLGDTVALKMLNAEHHDDIDEFEQRWRRIADFYVGRDWHPNLVKIFEAPFRGKLPHHSDDYFETGAETLYLPMEYLEGRSLRAHVTPRGTGDSSPALSVRRSYVRALEGIAQGLAELATVQGAQSSGSVLSKRAGLVHRDVKPDNIIFPPGRTPVLVDFGSMREMFTSRMYSGISGTAGYMAPEVTDHSVDWALRSTPAVDLYGFACVVYFTLSGQDPPVQQSRWMHHLTTFLDRQAIPAETQNLLHQVLLEEDPEARLKIDIAEWSRAVTGSLYPRSSVTPTPSIHTADRHEMLLQNLEDRLAVRRTDSTPATSPTPHENPATPTNLNPRPSESLPAPTATPDQPRQRAGKPDPPRSPQVPAAPPSAQPLVKPNNQQRRKKRRQTTKPTPNQAEKSSRKSPTPDTYIYLKNQGTLHSVPNQVGGIGTLTSESKTYKYVLTKYHADWIKGHTGSLFNFKVGSEVHFRPDADVADVANPVHPLHERFTFQGFPAPYKHFDEFNYAFVGASLAAALGSIAVVKATDQPVWQTILQMVAIFFIAFIATYLTLTERDISVPKYGYRTWWEDHKVMPIAGSIYVLTAGACGAVTMAANVPFVDRYVDAVSSLTSDGVLSGALRVLALLGLVIAVLCIGSVLVDILWAVYSKRTHLPLGIGVTFFAKLGYIGIVGAAFLDQLQWLRQVL